MPCPGRLTSGKGEVPLYRRLGGSQGWSGQMRKISPPPGFDLRTVQPVTSRYPGSHRYINLIFVLLIYTVWWLLCCSRNMLLFFTNCYIKVVHSRVVFHLLCVICSCHVVHVAASSWYLVILNILQKPILICTKINCIKANLHTG